MNSYKKYESNEDNPQFIFLEKIKAMFITIIEKQRQINDLKISLSNEPSLNLMNFFSEIDSKDKGFIDVNDVRSYLAKYSISFNEQALRRFIHQFDKQQKFHLLFDDFCIIFSPINEYYNFINNNNDLSSMQDKFLNILISTIELIGQINDMTIDIKKSNNFTSYEAFMGITKGNKYLDEEFMNHFLDHNYNNNEIKNLIYLIDLNNDSLISYEEFQDFFIPLIKYTENLYINNIFDFKDNKNDINDNNENDVYNKYNNYNFNSSEKNDNDIVNYEKSGKYRSNNSKDKNGIYNNRKYNENKNYNTYSQKPENISYNNYNKTIKMEKRYKNFINNYNDNNNYSDFKDKNYNSMNNLKYNKSYLNNYNQESNQLKFSKDEENNNNEKNSVCGSLNDNNNDELDVDNEYDEYCNFYKKTQNLLSTSKKKQYFTNSRENSINALQKTPNFNFQETSEKNSSKKDTIKNKNNNVYKNIKDDNDYIINIINNNKNKTKEYKEKNNLSINHKQVHNKPINTMNNDLKIEKNININLLDKNNNSNKNSKNNSTKKEENNINIINFTCGGINETEKGNTSSKKIDISNNNNNYT